MSHIRSIFLYFVFVFVSILLVFPISIAVIFGMEYLDNLFFWLLHFFVFSCVCVYHYLSSSDFSFILKIYKNGVLEKLNKKQKIIKRYDLGVLERIHLERESYGGGKASFIAVNLIGNKSKLTLKKIPIQYYRDEAVEEACQWSVKIANWLDIPINK